MNVLVILIPVEYLLTYSSNMIPDWMDATANKQGWDSIAKELEKIEPGCVSRALE